MTIGLIKWRAPPSCGSNVYGQTHGKSQYTQMKLFPSTLITFAHIRIRTQSTPLERIKFKFVLGDWCQFVGVPNRGFLVHMTYMRSLDGNPGSENDREMENRWQRERERKSWRKTVRGKEKLSERQDERERENLHAEGPSPTIITSNANTLALTFLLSLCSWSILVRLSQRSSYWFFHYCLQCLQ